MALEAVVFQQGLLGHNSKELYNLLGENWGYDDDSGLDKKEAAEEVEKAVSFGFLENQTESFLIENWNSSSPTLPLAPPSMLDHFNEPLIHQNEPTPEAKTPTNGLNSSPANDRLPPARAKRRRSRTRKNKEEIENQRMAHIAVERNRRKQMNEYLSVLRSLMPESYVQRGDQASIIGGAINFVKELEQRLQLHVAHKEMKRKSDGDHASALLPFSEFFMFPQYSSTSSSTGRDNSVAGSDDLIQSAAKADVEVTIVDCHANLKIRSKKQPKQLLKVVSGLNSLHLTILHLNVSTVDQTVLYSISVKIEDDCELTSVDEIAKAVYQMISRI